MSQTTHDAKHRILYITSDTSVLRDGSVAQDQIRLLASLTRELYVIVLNTHTRQRVHALNEHTWLYATNSIHPIFFYFDVQKIIRKELLWRRRFRPELIIGDTVNWSGVLARRIARKYRRKYILRLRTRAACARKLLCALYARSKSVLHGARKIEVASDSLQETIRAYARDIANRIVVVPPYVNVPFITQAEPAFSAKEQFPQFRFLMVLTGPMRRAADVKTAVSVLVRVNRKVAGVGLIVLHPGPKKRLFKRLLKEANMEQYVVFSDDTDTISYYKTADLFLMTQTFVDTGVALIHAFACGIPVVTTRVGVADYLLGGTQYEEFICPVGDTACLVDRVMYVIEHTRIRNDFRMNAQSFAYERLMPEKETYLKQYQDMWHAVLVGEENSQSGA